MHNLRQLSKLSPSSKVLEAVKKAIGVVEKNPNYETIVFKDGAEKSNILKNVSTQLGQPIPDTKISEIRTAADLISFLSQAPLEVVSRIPHSVKGIPQYEILNGLPVEQIPPNITLLNYRKKKWTDKMAADFVVKQTKALSIKEQ